LAGLGDFSRFPGFCNGAGTMNANNSNTPIRSTKALLIIRNKNGEVGI